MNYPIAVAFGLTCLAILAHVAGGIRESLTVRPSASAHNSASLISHARVERSWVQLMCAFQMVSIDLVAVAGVLYLLAFTDFLFPSAMIAFAMSILFALWGLVWLVQLASLKRSKRDYLFLGQWALWFACSALLYWGARTL